MKKIFLLLFLILIFSLTSCKENPYNGKYVYKKNNSIILELNADNRFLMMNIKNRSVDYISGKYTVENNQIILTSIKNKSSFLKDDKLEGTIEGAKITFSNFTENKSDIFIKP